MTDKHTLSLYYGIDENLPDNEFYKKIKEINCLAEEKAKKFNNKRGETYERYTH